MAEPLKHPDPTTLPTDPGAKGDAHVDALKKAYDKAAETVAQTPPETPEYFRARQAKKEAFQKYNDAQMAKVETDAVVANAEQKQQAAEAAAREAQAAKKAAADAHRKTAPKP